MTAAQGQSEWKPGDGWPLPEVETMCVISTPSEPVICDGGCGLAVCPKGDATPSGRGVRSDGEAADSGVITKLAPRSVNYRGRDTGGNTPMSDQLTPQDQQNIDEVVDDFFAFKAAARGPESRFVPGDRVTPVFARGTELGTVLETANAEWAKQNLYPCNPQSFAAKKWDDGAVKVNWDALGVVWWPTYSLVVA